MVGRDPSCSIQYGLLPAMKALISDKLFRHPNTDVKVSIVSCIHEVLRITAPKQPYEDETMKEILESTLTALEKLSFFSGCSYFKVLHILEMAKIKSPVILLDLGCNAIVTQRFQLLLNTIRFNHSHAPFSNMEEIMTLLIAESDEISLDLLKPLLSKSKIRWRMRQKYMTFFLGKLWLGFASHCWMMEKQRRGTMLTTN
ncbi:hypothetical protein ACH5RR_024683 [Cinchona calisaya]|uniref:Uncharacterized protein n=1 Tax=Cinchona calisaya TaxID=153742 RepID=A0ABD2YYA2_9GENT